MCGQVVGRPVVFFGVGGCDAKCFPIISRRNKKFAENTQERMRCAPIVRTRSGSISRPACANTVKAAICKLDKMFVKEGKRRIEKKRDCGVFGGFGRWLSGLSMMIK